MMRTLTLVVGLTVVSIVGCSKKQPRADTNQSAYVQLLNFRCGNYPSRACSASERKQAEKLCRRAAAEVDVPPSTAVDRAIKLESIADRAKEMRLPRTGTLFYARRAFDHYFANERFFWADHVFHKFRIEDETRHRNLVLNAYAGMEYGRAYTPLLEEGEWMRSHPLDELSARRVYELAMENRNFDLAEIVARRFHFSERQYLEAVRAKLAKRFEEAMTQGAHVSALLIAENSEARIPRDQVLAIALQAYESNLRGDHPFEAHRIAAKYNLGESYLRRALDAAFADAVSRGTYQLARQLPSGEFIIIAPPGRVVMPPI